MSKPLTVMIDGEKYVPQKHKVCDEALLLLRELVKETPYKSELRTKASRLQYLLTDGNGNAR